jgi:hypothetical protein
MRSVLVGREQFVGRPLMTRDPFDRRAKRAIESRNIELVGISFETRLVIIPGARILAGFQSRLPPRRRGSALSFIPARGFSLSLSLSLSPFSRAGGSYF